MSAFQPCVRIAVRNVVSHAGPTFDLSVGADQIGQGDSAIQRHPTHQRAVQVSSRRAANFPDALVFVLPARRRRVHGGDQEILG